VLATSAPRLYIDSLNAMIDEQAVARRPSPMLDEVRQASVRDTAAIATRATGTDERRPGQAGEVTHSTAAERVRTTAGGG